MDVPSLRKSLPRSLHDQTQAPIARQKRIADAVVERRLEGAQSQVEAHQLPQQEDPVRTWRKTDVQILHQTTMQSTGRWRETPKKDH